MKASFMLQPRDRTAVFAMEESWVSKTQKSTYAKKQIEDNADLFLWPPGICPTWNDGQCRLLLWCSKVSMTMCGTRGHRNGKTRTSLSTMTMPWLKSPLKFCSFGPRTTWQWFPIPILTRSGPLWLFTFPQAEASDEGSKIRHHWRDSRGIAEGTWHNSKKGLPGMLPSMAETLGPLYSCKMGVLWRWWRNLTSEVSKLLFTSTPLKLLDTSLC